LLYQSEGIVLFQADIGENDKIVTIFTEDEGIVRATVKGAQKPKSKLRALTQPFTMGLFQMYRGKVRDRVTQVEVKTCHPKLMDDYRKLVYAGYLSELLMSVMPERQANRWQFSFFTKVIECLEKREDPWPVAAWGQLGILSGAGFAPSFSKCVICGNSDFAPIYFSAKHGGIVCPECLAKKREAVGDWLLKICAGSRRTLELLLAQIHEQSSKNTLSCPKITARGQVRVETGQLLRKYISFILEKRLKSMALVESIENDEFEKS